MAETTIQWAHYTFNPWIGCQRVSPGCENCYAEAYDRRVGGVPKQQRADQSKPLLRWGPKAPRSRTSPSYWRQPLKWNTEATAAGERRRVFCASLADVFEQPDRSLPGRPDLDSWRLKLFELIRATPNLDWLLLTKRPQLIKHGLTGAIDAYARTPGCSEAEAMLQRWVDGEPPSNVWLGTTVEDQRRADERIPRLLEVPAVVRFLSCEPLLEPIDLSAFIGGPYVAAPGDVVLPSYNFGIDWIICGGESGAKARPFNVGWARTLLQRARAAGVAPFVKQLGYNIRTRNDDGLISDFSEGGWFLQADWQVEDDVHGFREEHQGAEVRIRLRDGHGGDPAEWPEDLRVREFPVVRRGVA